MLLFSDLLFFHSNDIFLTPFYADYHMLGAIFIYKCKTDDATRWKH